MGWHHHTSQVLECLNICSENWPKVASIFNSELFNQGLWHAKTPAPGATSELVTNEHRTKQSIIITRSLQPVATCRQSPYLHKPAIIIMASSHYDVICKSRVVLAPTALAAPVLIMTSFSLWRHSLLSWPRPALRTYVADTLPPLIYKDVYLLTFQRLIGYIYHLISCQ